MGLQKDVELLNSKTEKKAKTSQKIPKEKKRNAGKRKLKSTIPKVADFTIIEGIGPKIDQVLKAAGIYSMENLSKTKISRLQQILKEADGNFNFAVPTSWPEQALLAAEGKMKALQVLQDELIGGRKKHK